MPPAGLDDVPAAVEDVLRTFFDAAIPDAERIDPTVGEAAAVLRDFVMVGGKRVRPTLAYAGWLAARSASPGSAAARPCDAGEVSDAATVLRVGAALELIQGCALVHDDIIDRSDTRRGRPTVHRALQARHADAGWAGDSAAFGVSMAILLGDLSLSWADDLVHGAGAASAVVAHKSAVSGDRTSLPSAVADVWAAMRTEVLGGQIIDIVNESRGDESAAAAYQVMEFKTAAYTVSRPLHLGAALGGADDDLIERLRSMGHDLGIAFQLRDDLLGVFGDPATTGKPSGDDLVEGKRTALIAAGLDRADASRAAALRDSLGRPLTSGEIDRARGILVDVGAVTEIERQIDTLLTGALNTLDDLPVDDGIRTEIRTFARRLTHRRR